MNAINLVIMHTGQLSHQYKPWRINRSIQQASTFDGGLCQGASCGVKDQEVCSPAVSSRPAVPAQWQHAGAHASKNWPVYQSQLEGRGSSQSWWYCCGMWLLMCPVPGYMSCASSPTCVHCITNVDCLNTTCRPWGRSVVHAVNICDAVDAWR